MSKNGWFSTAQAPNPRPVADVTNALQAINNKLDMILDALTKPAVTNAEAEPKLWPAYTPMSSLPIDADTMQPVESKPEEPKRMSGKPAKEQIEDWIRRNFKTLVYFKKAAQFGLVSAKVHRRPVKANPTHRYTHILKFTGSFTESCNPAIFGQRELDEVVAYLESLGINVKNKAPNRV
jgi:hypothetical protein